MKLETAEALVEALEDLYLEGELYEDYEPRGYGNTTTGVVVDRVEDLIQAAAAAVKDMVDCVNERTAHIDEFIDDLRGLKVDNLGKNYIVY